MEDDEKSISQMTKQDWLNCVGKGWHDIVGPLIDRCEQEGVEIVQIKEKFGGLRFYYDGMPSAELFKQIEAAEDASVRICESCGKPGQIKVNSRSTWLKCTCEDCWR